MSPEAKPMHHPAKAWLGRVERALRHKERDEIVCTCNPGVHWTRSANRVIVRPQQHSITGYCTGW